MMNVMEAYELFKQFVGDKIEKIISIGEYDSTFFISNCQPGDFKRDCYVLDKKTKEFAELDFLQEIAFIKKMDDDNAISTVYTIKDGRIIDKYIDDPSTY